MRQTPERHQDAADRTVKDIRRKTRKRYSSEEKIRIVLAGLRGEDSIAELCRQEGILDPTWKSGVVLLGLHCLCLELDGACECQCRVPTFWIIEPVDVFGYGGFSVAS